MRGPSSDTDDPYLLTLGQIAAELTLIRETLQAMHATEEATDAADESFTCRCGASIAGEAAARTHAISDHGAPADEWREMYARA